MADAYSFIAELLLLASAVCVLRSVVQRLRGRFTAAEARQRVSRDFAWILSFTAAVLLADSLLLLLCDCSFQDVSHELRWWPSLLHQPAVLHRLYLVVGCGLGAFVLYSPSARALCRRPFGALGDARTGIRPPQPAGIWVIVSALLLGAVSIFVLGARSMLWFLSSGHWERLVNGRGLDARDLERFVYVLMALPAAWGLAMLAGRLGARRRVAWRIALGLALVSLATFGGTMLVFIQRSLSYQRTSLSLGAPELVVVYAIPPFAFSLWAACYLIVRRGRFGRPERS